MQSPWKTINSKIIYQNPHIAFRMDKVVTPTGADGEYGVVERPNGNFIVAMRPDHSVCMVKQFRYPVGAWTWELPAGGSDLGDADMFAAPKRELAEEAALQADEWTHLGSFYPAPGFVTEVSHVFLARNVYDIVHDGSDPDEDISDKKFFSLAEIARVMQGDEPFDGPSITAIAMACLKLGLTIG